MTHLYKFRLKYFFYGVLAAMILLVETWKSAANGFDHPEFRSSLTSFTDTIRPLLRKDTVPQRPSALNPDTTGIIVRDTIVPRIDTFQLKLSKDSLEAPLRYAAEDSAVVLIKEKKIILYGKTRTE